MVIVRFIVVFVVFSSTKIDFTVPVEFTLPVHVTVADIPPGVTTTLDDLQFGICWLLMGPPYLSTMACVTQTCVVRGTPAGALPGMPLMLMVVETSYRPGFSLCPCACPCPARVAAQTPSITPIRMWLIDPPDRAGEGSACIESSASCLARERFIFQLICRILPEDFSGFESLFRDPVIARYICATHE
jgi:hypothetical protein